MKVSKFYPSVVKITRRDDGDPVKREDQRWCLVTTVTGGNATLCTCEFFGLGESRADFVLKTGKITCPDCIAIIKTIKAVKL